MRNGDRQAVSRVIRPGRFLQVQQVAHHEAAALEQAALLLALEGAHLAVHLSDAGLHALGILGWQADALRRLGDLLSRIRGRIIHTHLSRVSPLAVPVMLDIGKESVSGDADEHVLREAADDLVKEAMDAG